MARPAARPRQTERSEALAALRSQIDQRLQECARLMAAAIAGRRRQLMTSTRGKLASVVRDLFPDIVDLLTARQSKKANLH